MKKGHFKYDAVGIPLYCDLLHIAVGGDIAAICQAADLPVADLNGQSLSAYVGYAFVGQKEGVTGYFIFLVDYAKPGTIAHEALHISHKIMADRGLKPDYDNDEAHAYLLGWIVNEVHRVFEDKAIAQTKKIALK